MKKRKIIICDNLSPEDIAKTQALYSRSADSVTDHLEKVKEQGSSKFMERFYVEYGHGSIGDCGTTTIFIENVSILAAKAIQDWPLYNGQETSTRYIIMTEQPRINPLESEEGRQLLESWMEFYDSSQEETKTHLKNLYLRGENEDEKTYDKAIKARAFDTLRAFLPGGVCTQLSWHTTLRQAADKLALLHYHPLEEVREIAREIHDQLKEKYSASFSHKIYPLQEAYREKMVKMYSYYFNEKSPDFKLTTNIDPASLEEYHEAFTERPIKTNLPIFLAELGTCTCEYLLDYGSSRDAQRHRNGIFRPPLLTTKLGFHEWYLQELPERLRDVAVNLIKKQSELISKLEVDDETRQYYIGLGFLVSCKTCYALPQMAYVTELRGDKTVHPTYREIAHKMHQAVIKHFPIMKLHTDMDENNWDIRRGKQDIIKKS